MGIGGGCGEYAIAFRAELPALFELCAITIFVHTSCGIQDLMQNKEKSGKRFWDRDESKSRSGDEGTLHARLISHPLSDNTTTALPRHYGASQGNT